tara:strand:- start:67 stop:882 length:816 start_codon:yes stop_codon:yes gene_type:complete
MATYKSDAGAILQPGNQINKLSSFNNEGVFGWPGIELFEQVGFVKITNLSADKANNKSFNITVPSPDRRVDDRVRDDRTSLVVKASAGRPAYVYGASIAIAQDTPTGGLPSFPASPITADIGGTTSELLLLGPDNSGSPFGVPSTQLNGLAAASSSITAASSLFAQGSEDTTTGDFPAWTSVTSTIAAGDAANSMMFKVTADTTFKVYNVNAITGTSVNGDGVFISQDDSDAGRAGYIVCRVNYLRPAKAVTWDDISSFIDFASQVGGTDS